MSPMPAASSSPPTTRVHSELSSRSPARRLSRRTFLAGGIAAAGAVGAGAIVLANRSGSGSKQQAAPSPTRTPRPASPTFAPSPTATPLPQGGIIRLAAPARFNFDTFDSQQTGEPSVIEILGRTHSRLLQWADLHAPTLGPDLVARWEQPDAQTLILHLDAAARWSPAPGFPGRSVTADDVVLHLLRALEIAKSATAPLAQRYQDFVSFDRVHSPASGVVSIAFSSPDPFALETLAGEFALVQAPEVVAALEAAPPARPARVVGSGPFRPRRHRDGSLVFSRPRGHPPRVAFDCSMSASRSTTSPASPRPTSTRSSPATVATPRRSVLPVPPRSTPVSSVRW